MLAGHLGVDQESFVALQGGETAVPAGGAGDLGYKVYNLSPEALHSTASRRNFSLVFLASTLPCRQVFLYLLPVVRFRIPGYGAF